MAEQTSRLLCDSLWAVPSPRSQPLPFFAYPFLVATLLGRVWQRYRSVV